MGLNFVILNRNIHFYLLIRKRFLTNFNEIRSYRHITIVLKKIQNHLYIIST